MGISKERAKQLATERLEKDPEYFKRIGSEGGKQTAKRYNPGSFEFDRDRARSAGRKGGRISRRKWLVTDEPS